MRFYRDTNATTEVVWYRVPDDRPPLPFAHVFTSWEWEEDNRYFDRHPGTAGLGEQVEATRTYPGRPLPRRRAFFNRFCGDAKDWLFGAGLPVVQPPLLRDGFPPCCGHTRTAMLGFNCPDLLKMVLALRAQYEGRAVLQNFVLSQIMDDAEFPYSENNTPTLTPGITVAVDDDWCVAFVSGTTNINQWLQHALGSVQPSTYHLPSGEPISTAPMYWNAGNTLAGLVGNGNPARLPTFLVGHSYGGAVAYIAALILASSARPIDVSVVTFGAPRALRLGGLRVWAGYRIPTASIINDSDPIPRMPLWLTISTLTGVGAVLGILWQMWGDNPERLGLRVNGSIYGNPTSYAPISTALYVLARLAANQDFAPWGPHDIDEYVRRLRLQNCEGLVIADLFIWLEPESFHPGDFIAFVPPGDASAGLYTDNGKFGHTPFVDSHAPGFAGGTFGFNYNVAGPFGWHGFPLTYPWFDALSATWFLDSQYVGWDTTTALDPPPFPFPGPTFAGTWFYAIHMLPDFFGSVGSGPPDLSDTSSHRMYADHMIFNDGFTEVRLDFPSELVGETERVYFFVYHGDSVFMGMHTPRGFSQETFDIGEPSGLVQFYSGVGAFVPDEPVESSTQWPLDLAVLYEVMVFTGALSDDDLARMLQRLSNKYFSHLLAIGGTLLGGSSTMSGHVVFRGSGGLFLGGSSTMVGGVVAEMDSGGGGCLLGGSSTMS